MNINFIFRSCSCNSSHDFRLNRFAVASGHQFKKTKSLLILLAMLLFVPSIQTLAQSKMVGNSTAGYETSTAGTSMETAKQQLTVNNVADLEALRDAINSGKSFVYHGNPVSKFGEGTTFKLTTDLDLSSVCGENKGNWTPIGTYVDDENNIPFKGGFNGDGHTISNLYIDASSNCQGLFGYTYGNDNQIRNLNLVNTYVKGNKYVGSLCGFSDHTAISNCTNSGSVSGTDQFVGGLCGYSRGYTSISNCLNTASVSGINNNVGGLCGQLRNSSIIDCLNSGSVSGKNFVGGLSGWLADGSSLKNSLNTGSVCGTGSWVNCGSVCAVESFGNTIGYCYFDNQMSFKYGAVNGLNENNVQGKKTTQMTGTALKDDLGTNWVYVDGMYPRPEGIENTNAAIAAAKPIFLASSEKVNNVLSNFTIGTGDNVTWETYGNGSSLIVSGANVTVDCCGNDTLVAKINGIIYKMVALNIPYSEAHPYTIDNVADLQTFRNGINTGADFKYKGNNVPTGGNDIYFKLTADLDLSSVCGENKGSWSPIGNDSKRFKGHFDGGGHSISNLYINTSSSDYQGLFGYVEDGDISNLNLVNTNVKGHDFVGAVAGKIEKCTINNCSNSGNLIATNYYVGGVAGYATKSSSISNCTNSGRLESNYYAGGMSGRIIDNSNISNCSNSGNLSSAESFVGGMSGYTYSSTISNCINSGSLSGTLHVGGVTGFNLYSSTISNCISSGNISAVDLFGGVCGENDNSTVSNCYYDKQMCTVSGINNIDVAGKAEGKLTTEMAGTALQAKLGTTNWVFANGMYPRPKGIENTNAAIVSATPIFLAVTDATTYETVESVATNFTYSGAGSITWSSTQVCLTFNNGNATLTQSGDDIITATNGNVSKSIAVRIILEVSVSISGMDVVCEGNSITLTANSDATTPTYKWYKNGSLLTGSTSQTLTVAPTTTTVYKVRVTETYHNVNNWSEAEKTVTVSSSNTGDTTAVACDRFTWHGIEYTSTPSVAPTYTLTNAAGCDSVVTLHLTINESNTGDTTAVACDRFTWHGIEYTSTPSVAPTYTLENAAGCDSVVTLHLTINESNTGDTTVVECDRFTWYGTEYTSTPSVAPTYTLTNAAGCDSVVTLHLTINNSSTGDTTVVECDRFTWHGIEYTSTPSVAPTYTLENAAGCDSVVILHLTINESNTGDTTVVECDRFTWHGIEYTSTPSVAPTYTLENAAGCDSVVTLHLTINESNTGDTTAVACDRFTWHGIEYTSTPSVAPTYTLENAAGCDSVVTLHLTINASETNEFSATACDEYTWNATTYNTSGDYEQTFQNTLACDSVVTLHLTINASETNEFSATACDEYTWNATTYNTSGDYVQTFQNTLACDSVVTLHLTINASETNEFSATACDEYTWNATTYNTSGDYEQTFQNTLACDSVVTLHLTINASETNEFSATACDEYTWNNTTYDASGDYEQTFQNTLACDSVVTLHLTINASETNEFSATACDEYTWNATTYNTSGDYVQTFQNTLACDSVVTLHLTINASETNEFSATACDEYTWNATTYNTSGDYEQTFQNTLACDSVVTLHLTINASETNEFSATACDEYTWNTTTYNTSGDYVQTFQNTLACDSVVTLHLTINASETNEFSETVCNSYTWNTTTYATSGDYEQTLQNAAGCDSIVTLHLTVNYAPSISAITAPNTIVHGESLTLTAPQITENGSSVTAQGWQISNTMDFSETIEDYTGQTLAYTYSNWYLRYFATSDCGTSYSNVVQISVLGYPVIGTVAQPEPICNGEALSLVAPSVDFRQQTDLGQGWQLAEANTFANAMAYTNQTLDHSYNNWYLRYFATNAAGTSYSDTLQITVNPEVTVNAVESQILCNGEDTDAISFGTTTVGGTMSYNWTNSNTSIGLAANGNGNIATFAAVNNGSAPQVATITVTPTLSMNGIECQGGATSFTITVNPTAVVNAIDSQVLCNGNNTSDVLFSTTNTGGTMRYAWTNDNTSIGLAANGEGNISSFAAVNDGTAPVVATITVTPYFTNEGVECSGETESFTITVNPTAVVNAIADQVLCNGDNTSNVLFTTTNTGGTMRYAWTNDNTSIGLAANGEGNISSFAAVNDGTAPVVATITVTPYFTNEGVECSGETESFTITVNPTAVVNAIDSQVLCNGDNTSDVLFTTTNTGGTMRYAWTNDNTSIGLAANGEGNISSFAAVNNGTAPVVATITVTPYFTNEGVECSGETESFTITVNPTPVITIREPENNYCSGSTITLSAVMPVGAYPMTVVWGGDLTPETQYYEGPRAFATFTLPVTDTDVNYNINIQATDANGCISDIDEVVVSVPAQLVASVSPIVSPYCHGGNDGHAVGHAIGGVAPYRYEWSTTPAFVGQYCGNLSAGTYSLTVTDAYGCTDVVTFEVEDATAVVAEINGYENPTCGNRNGWAEVSATGGHSGYTYLWSNGKTTRRISGLAAGTYSVTVTDDNGCQATASVTLTEADAITLNVTTHDVTCNGGNDGHAIASVDGGMEPYSIRWSNNHTGEYINQLSAGSYSVTVTDANGCEATESFVINEPAALNAGSIATEGEQIEVGGDPSEISSVADATSGVEITYRWKVNGTVIENSDDASFDPSSSYGNTVGTYTFTREVKDACNEWTLSEGEWILTVVRPDGISEEDAHNLQVYPNPTKGNTKVVCQGMSKITILTMTGQVVAIETVDADETILSLGSYIPGVYMVRIETADGNVFNRRVTVAK